MDKYLLLLGFQMGQTLALGALDPRFWKALLGGGAITGLDREALGVLVQAILSGTWIGRVAELGGLLANAATSHAGLPLVLLVLQWAVVMGFMFAERRVFARRLARMAARN